MSKKEQISKGILNGLEEMEEKDSNINNNINFNNNIIIKKRDYKTDKHIQKLFYITPELDNFIEKLKKKTGRDRSEIVRIALTYFKENVEIKK